MTYRILAHTIVADSLVARLRVFFGGTGLSRLSQALLRSGQHFYLIAVVTHVPFLFLPQSNTHCRGMLVNPALALVNNDLPSFLED
ncbi:hypothetical protein MSAN_00588800 [Mycena sanguinolenta]|uniref:Uncharacterized protein n=1 Tax=Mycena sanguinolenta TaxID=230812 RepID=A0A8H6ZBD5_9AGAR|nr:hypothetical protein MSAN_00588800 [Mycena sanguinolenta]